MQNNAPFQVEILTGILPNVVNSSFSIAIQIPLEFARIPQHNIIVIQLVSLAAEPTDLFQMPHKSCLPGCLCLRQFLLCNALAYQPLQFLIHSLFQLLQSMSFPCSGNNHEMTAQLT